MHMKKRKYVTSYYCIRTIVAGSCGRIVFPCLLNADFFIPVTGKNGGWPYYLSLTLQEEYNKLCSGESELSFSNLKEVRDHGRTIQALPLQRVRAGGQSCQIRRAHAHLL